MLRGDPVSDPDTPLPWYAEGLAFDCTRCGNCCSGAPGHVWVTAHEIRRIAAHCGVRVAEFCRKHVRRIGFGHSLLELPGGDCEFLERLSGGTTACRLHSVRPTQCRTWPFWKSNLESCESWTRTGADCPGINRGAHLPFPMIQALLTENGRRPL